VKLITVFTATIRAEEVANISPLGFYFQKDKIMSSKSSSSSGLSCGGVVQVILIVLKLLGLLTWSWWWVMSPSLTVIAVGLVVFAVLVVVGVIENIKA
jgi:hypothetical protein